ncbi:hypothetical protein BHE74_00051670 [Ensete ventricosum]|nr:hypothetical protein BHE74_00051670 [Ensete ventricosum]
MKRPQAEPSRSPPPGLPRRRMERVEQTIPRPPNIPLSSTQTEIFLQIREKGLLKTPNQMKSQPEDRDRRRYCRFHRDYGHDMEECYNLKNQIEDLILERQVDVIVGGPAMSDDSSSARKAYAHAEVQKRPQAWGPGITFESENEYLDHDDALVIIACIANARVRHIMIDTGSSVDILYLDAFQKLRMTNRDHVPMTSTLIGFTRDTITPVGVATLPMTFDDEPRTKTFMVPFMVVNLPSAVDVLVRLASADTPGDLSVSHNLCRPTVATIEMATMLGLEEHCHLGQREDIALQASSIVLSPIQIGAQDPDFLLKLPPLAPEGLQLSLHLLNLALQLFCPTLSDCDQLLVDSSSQLLVHSPKS